MFQTLHFQQRIKRIILIYHAERRCISLMPQAATNGIEWLHSAFVFIRCTFRCIVHCINSSYSKYSLLKKASEPLARRSQTSIELMFSFTAYKLLVIIFLLNRLTGYHTERNPTAITVTNISNKSIHRTLTG